LYVRSYYIVKYIQLTLTHYKDAAQKPAILSLADFSTHAHIIINIGYSKLKFKLVTSVEWSSEPGLFVQIMFSLLPKFVNFYVHQFKVGLLLQTFFISLAQFTL